ncbi:MAG: hypothetical protein R2748_21445 [Bryobacterales bacterium]
MAELAAHEHELLARMPEHVRVKRPQIGELLPLVAGHLRDHRALAMHDLVVGERQHEVLREGVEHRERDVVLVVLAVNRLLGEVAQDVVHPAHVPLEAEAQPTQVGRVRDAAPGGRFLGHHHGVRVLGVDALIEPADEVDGFDVLLAAVLVGHPFALVPAVVEIEHRGDRVHAQAVDVVAVQPKQRVANQKVRNLAPPVVEHHRVPMRVATLPRVGVFIQVRAVEVDQPVRVVREVRRHPVHQHAHARPVQRVDQVHQLLRRAEARGRRIVSNCLVPPRAVEGVLGDRHQLHVGETHLLAVGREPRRQIHVSQPAALWCAHPGAQVHLIDRDRRLTRIALLAVGHPFVVAPLVTFQAPNLRRRARTHFRREAVRIGLFSFESVVVGADEKLVDFALANVGDKRLPNAGIAAATHRVRVAVPAVEIADDGDRTGVRRPNGETHAGLAVELGQMRTELFVVAVMAALAEEVQVVIGQKRGFHWVLR